jgi:hypothetical protein
MRDTLRSPRNTHHAQRNTHHTLMMSVIFIREKMKKEGKKDVYLFCALHFSYISLLIWHVTVCVAQPTNFGNRPLAQE